MAGEKVERSEPTQAAINRDVQDRLHNNIDMRSPVFNHMEYEGKSKQIDGPKLQDLHIVGDAKTNEHYRQIAKDGAAFIAINGNINLAVKHALEEANDNDKLHAKGGKNDHATVDKLLSYMNKELFHTVFSVTRDGNKFMLLDSRDNHGTRPANRDDLNASDRSIRHDASGKAILNAREQWNLDTKRYVR
ncbi:MAG: hypothetical protein WCT03_20510 [Candidatus Obscuribacterales bacterium]|jgi:hypothetical protein